MTLSICIAVVYRVHLFDFFDGYSLQLEMNGQSAAMSVWTENPCIGGRSFETM